jgi:hypothetical protein
LRYIANLSAGRPDLHEIAGTPATCAAFACFVLVIKRSASRTA